MNTKAPRPSPPFDPLFGTHDDVVAQATPIGTARAGKILAEHPDAPRPILGGERPGSKAIYSLIQTRRFWQSIAENGLPSIEGIPQKS